VKRIRRLFVLLFQSATSYPNYPRNKAVELCWRQLSDFQPSRIFLSTGTSTKLQACSWGFL